MDFSELLDRFSVAEDDDTTELELSTDFAELLSTTSELEPTFAELDNAAEELNSTSSLNGYGSSLTKYGELSDESLQAIIKTENITATVKAPSILISMN